MSPLPPFEKPSHTPEGHEKPTWPWESAQKNSGEKEEIKKDKKEPKKEKEKEARPKNEKKSETKETPKAPEEKRASLVEQALELVTKHEEEPIPRDAPTLARIMVAHHVIHLHEQLQHPDQLLEGTSVKDIEATLDYIVQLDNKFKDPSIEATPEIEASYQELIELAEATLREEPQLEKVVADFAEKQDTTPAKAQPSASFEPYSRQPSDSRKQKPDPVEEEFERRKTAVKNTLPAVTAAVALIYSVAHLGRKKRKEQQKTEATAGSSNPLTTPQPHHTVAAPSSDTSRPNTPELAASPSTESPHTRPYEAPGPPAERVRPLPPREFSPPPPRRSTAPVAAAAIATTLALRSSSGEQKQATPSALPSYATPIAEISPRQHSETSSHEAPSGSDRKIEHMPLLQLLSMAEGISLDHGRYLRREFESGTIDKEGLIKILKAQSKGLDYKWEFRQQAGKFAALKATSPEFLHSATKPATDDTEDISPTEPVAPPTPDEFTNPDSNKGIRQPISLAPPQGDHPLLPKFASRVQPKPQTSQRIFLITALAIGSLIVIGILASAIFAWLD